MIWFTSDLHFSHNREFIYGPRGFSNVEDMNRAIVENFNKVVGPNDDVYILGDVCLGGGSDEAMRANKEMISSLKGKLHIILGNHDSDARIEMYKNCHNVVEVVDAKFFKYDGWTFFLSHYPSNTSNLEKEFSKHCVLNLYGHTHQKSNFYNGIPYMYHVGVDSHNCSPVSIDTILKDIKKEVKNCLAEI